MDFHDVLTLMRPRQWTKNLVVFAAIIFSANLFSGPMLLRVVVAFVALCLVSSGLYAMNDAADADYDREHPVKRERPVASGRVSRQQAVIIAVVLVGLGVGVSVLLGLPFLAAVAGYLTIQVLYTMYLKHVVIADMLTIAAGFVIKAVAGALVISVPVSPWLILCTGLLALFLAAAKRRHEIVLLRERSGGHRPVLSEYSAELLDSFMVTLSAATITSYALYTFFEAKAPRYGMMLTIPFVIYGVLRYQFLVLRKEGGGRPEEILLADRPILACIGAWIVCAIAVLYAGRFF